MATFKLEDEGTPTNGREAKEAAAERGDSNERMVLAGFERELDEAMAELKKFSGMDPGEVLLSLSSWHARAFEMRTRIQRSSSRRADAFRTRQLDPFMDACEFQFKIHSRLHSVRQFDWDLSKGQG
jgi:hypothetical protein